MSASYVAVNPERFPGNDDEVKVRNWKFFTRNNHILGSKCSNPKNNCPDVGETEKCQYCLFNQKITLPQLPDMVFALNMLSLTHDNGANINFNALDALQGVSPDKMDLVVSCAQAWKDSRRNCKLLEEGVKNPFDWTFTTKYDGTIKNLTVEETEEKINLEKLRRKEKILFYKDMTLFEDELHDNGIAVCNVKIRVMPDSFYILLRYFLRVDGVLVRINDTRMYHEFNWSYVLREFTSREARLDQINIPSALCVDPNEIVHLVPLVISKNDKLNLPIVETPEKTLSNNEKDKS